MALVTAAAPSVAETHRDLISGTRARSALKEEVAPVANIADCRGMAPCLALRRVQALQRSTTHFRPYCSSVRRIIRLKEFDSGIKHLEPGLAP